jgi:hypothetical protein
MVAAAWLYKLWLHRMIACVTDIWRGLPLINRSVFQHFAAAAALRWIFSH